MMKSTPVYWGVSSFGPSPNVEASRIVQNLGRAMRRINEMRMRRSEIASELVQRVVTMNVPGGAIAHTLQCKVPELRPFGEPKSPSPKTSGRLRLSSVSMPLTSAPTDAGMLGLLACWFIRRSLVCATMMWSWERPAKRREWKLIVSGSLVYELMVCLTSTARCSSAICGYLAYC